MTEQNESGTVVVGVVADPDLPARLARDLAETLPAVCARRGDRTQWRVEVFDDPFEAMYPDLEFLIDKAGRHVRDTSWDLALCLTDLPMRTDGRILLASVDPRHRVGLISLPALGGVRLRHRLRESAAGIVAALHRGAATAAERPAADAGAGVPLRGIRTVDEDDGGVLVSRGTRSGFSGLLAGMVRANRPWRLFIGLSSALAGALAGTAFGVLYSTIWQLATAMGPARLAGAAVVAMAALSVWIIVGHGLWERTTSDEAVSRRDVRLRNAGTVVTVAIGAVVFFGALFLLTLAAAGLIVPPAYLATVLGGPVHIGDYLTIAVMATALGTVAGAVGSGLEDDLSVRKATYGYRERERREWAARQNDPGRS
ncbi:hypothetical protein [Nocardia sp. NPDC051750]|uniref:hypothetical protein n=1 Tax=Nocardia sp. NPDC051750 TaxID=3364325 RepID=UPI0037930DEB